MAGYARLRVRPRYDTVLYMPITITTKAPPPPVRHRPDNVTGSWTDRLDLAQADPGEWLKIGPFRSRGSIPDSFRRAVSKHQGNLTGTFAFEDRTISNEYWVWLRFTPDSYHRPGSSPSAAAVADAQEGQPGTTSDAGAPDRPDAGAPLPVSPAPVTGTTPS